MTAAGYRTEDRASVGSMNPHEAIKSQVLTPCLLQFDSECNFTRTAVVVIRAPWNDSPTTIAFF